MQFSLRIPGALAPCLFVLAASVGRADQPQLVTQVEGITEYRLDNGLKVLLFPDPSKPQVTVNLTIFVGSRHEGYGETGMAHLLEHMLFKGTPTHENVPKALQDHGATFNGTTWYDRTNYYETLPASPENLQFALRLEADRMMNSYVKAEDLKSEMSVVRNEFEIGENSPTSILMQRMSAVAYEWHNYGQDTIGNRADIERVPIESLQEFYKKYYQPDNAMVIVAGQFEPETALAYIDQYFAPIPRPERELPQTYTEEPPQDGERLVTLRRVGDVTTVGMLYHICSGAHPDYVSLDVLAQVLGGSPSGRLYKALVDTRRAASVSSSAYALHDPGIMRFLVEVTPGNDARDIVDQAIELVETASESEFTTEEVERAKQYWMKEWQLAMADSATTAVQLSEWASQGDWRLMFLYRDRLEQVTSESVKDVAARYLLRSNRTVGMFIPTTEPERATVPATPNLAEMIGEYKGREVASLGEAFDVSPENIDARTQIIKLSSGMPAALLAKQTRGQAVHLQLNLRYGSLASLRGRTLACEMLPQLMMRGTTKLSRDQIQDQQDQNFARILPTGVVGEATFTVETKRENLPAVIELLRQILREPVLKEGELELLRAQYLAITEKQVTDPTALAQNAMSRAINQYPRDDPRYVPTAAEKLEGLRALMQADIGEVYAAFLSGRHGELAVVGDFDAEEIVPLLEGLVADWNLDAEYTRIPKEGDVELTSEVTRILTPDKESATYFAATVLPMSDADADYPALAVATEILGGGGLSSRLGDRVRQQDGLSYSVGAFLIAQSLDPRTTVALYAMANPPNILKAADAIKEEFVQLIEAGVKPEELESAKTGYLEAQKIARADDASLALVLADNLEAGRTMQFYANQEKLVSELTVDGINSVIARRLDPKRLPVAIAGDLEKAAQGGSP